MSRLHHCLSGVCDGASLRSRLMPLADFLTLEYLRCRNRTSNTLFFLRVPYQSKKQSSHLCKPCKKFLFKEEYTIFYFTIKDFLLLTTSKITAASRTRPLTTFCRFWSIPMILIPKFRTPISNAPMITPGTVPVPP